LSPPSAQGVKSISASIARVFLLITCAVASVAEDALGGSPDSFSNAELKAMRDTKDPKSFYQGLVQADWRGWTRATRSEMKSWKDLGVYSEVKAKDRKPGAMTIPLMEVYTRKWKKSQHGLEKHKLRLVAWGQLLRREIDYAETFAPTVSGEVVRMFLAISVQSGEVPESLDVCTAYLQSAQQETLYAYPPSFAELCNKPVGELIKLRNDLLKLSPKELRALGKATPGKRLAPDDVVWQLHRSVYGVPSAGRSWADRFRKILVEKLGLCQSKVDPCLYFKKDKGSKDWLLVLVFVDDCPFVGTPAAKKWFVDEVRKWVKIVYFGQLTEFLGMAVQCNNDEITVDHEQMIMALSHKYETELSQHKWRCFGTPARERTIIIPATDEEWEQAKHLPYPNLVGALAYIVQWTKPEAQCIVSMLTAHLRRWSVEMWLCALDTLHYFVDTASRGIRFTRSQDPHGANIMYCYADADLAMDVATRRSRGGRLVCLNGGPIAFRSSLQRVIQLSSAGAEIVAQVDVALEALGMRRLMKEIGLDQIRPTIIYQDNQAAITISHNAGSLRKQTKHQEMRVYKMRELLENGDFVIKFCKSARMVADIFTKNLGRVLFQRLRDILTGYVVPKLPGAAGEE